MKRALITGITGQDGSYLAEFLLDKGYEVHGMRRRSSYFNTSRIDHIFKKLNIHYGEITDEHSIRRLLGEIQPDEIYNLAAQSHVQLSFAIPTFTTDTIVSGILGLLGAVREICPKARIYQASSSEMFGGSDAPLNENSPFQPRSPYACAKLCAHNIAGVYREAYGMWIARGILFNHESPRRTPTFVTRKITCGIADIVSKKETKLMLGNLQAKRDWGYAPEYCENMWKMLQQDQADDFVIGTGESHSILEFVKGAFEHAGLDYAEHVGVEAKYMRPLEVGCLIADPAKSAKKLGWQPKVRFNELIKIMVDADLRQESNHPLGQTIL